MKQFFFFNFLLLSTQLLGANIDCQLTQHSGKNKMTLSVISLPYNGEFTLVNSGDATIIDEYAHEFQYTANISGPYIGLMMLHHLPTNKARFQTGMGPQNSIGLKIEEEKISFRCNINR